MQPQTSLTQQPPTAAFQPGLYRPLKKLANPAPLGLCAFGLAVFILGCIEIKVRDITQPSILVASASSEMAIGNSFGATVLSLYGGFWISGGIVFTPGGFNIMGSFQEAAGGSNSMFYDSLGLMLMAWFIFTIPMTLITLKSTVAFFALFFFADLALLLLGVGYLHRDAQGMPTAALTKSGGFSAGIMRLRDSPIRGRKGRDRSRREDAGEA
ncbi:GPR1/FUN34/yaaH family-domain-containing protein [Aspergillus pseudodeflectus]|uniref:GPR1/FUN34/yaaH family-domain-containing protein n=1 Tax=Aspergillus pseudodeflectus TaxID=176178 RepID=A0ABR4LAL8_9EURO